LNQPTERPGLERVDGKWQPIVKIIEQPGEDRKTAVIVLPRSEGAGVSIESEVGCNSSEELVTVLLQRLIPYQMQKDVDEGHGRGPAELIDAGQGPCPVSFDLEQRRLQPNRREMCRLAETGPERQATVPTAADIDHDARAHRWAPKPGKT
jgi:hypothetical protein